MLPHLYGEFHMNGYSARRNQTAFFKKRMYKYAKPIAHKAKEIQGSYNTISSIGQNNLVKKIIAKNSDQNNMNEPIIDTEVSNVITVSARKVQKHNILSREQRESISTVDTLPFEERFSLKITLCNVIYDFTNPNEDIEEKDTKTKVLCELVQFFEQKNEAKNLSVKFQLKTLKMIETNIYRPIPTIKISPFLMDFSTVFVEPSWPQLFYVYQILNRVIILYPNSSYFTLDFFKIIIYLTNMPDNNERQQILAFLRSFYDTHQSLKMEIIEVVRKKLLDAHDSENPPFCITPLLVFLAHIYQRCYKQPPDKYFTLIRVSVFQLVTSSFLPIFHQHLVSLLQAIFEQGSDLNIEFFQTVIKYWPLSNSQKQACFVEMLLLCMSKMNPAQVNDNIKTALTHLSDIIMGDHVKAAEAVFDFILNSAKDQQWFVDQSKKAIPYLYDYIHEVSQTHWSPVMREKATNCLLEMGKIDRKTFLSCKQKKPADLKRREQDTIRQAVKGWQKVVHQISDPNFDRRSTVQWIKDELHYEKPYG